MSFGYFSLGFGAGGGATPRIVATGGSITEDGDYKIHTFTSNGDFEITEAPAGETVDWMVVAGGGGAGCRIGGAGGAGGMRFSFPNEDGSGQPVSAQTYPIVIGGGGSSSMGNNNVAGQAGQNSSGLGFTSSGGGGGGSQFHGFTIQKVLARDN